MTESFALTALALATLLGAFIFGPVLIVTRGALRPALGPHIAKLRAPGLATGGTVGAATAVLLAGALFGGHFAVICATLALLAILATMDLLWRWLPYEWTLPLLFLALGSALLNGTLADAALGAALGGGLLFALRTTYLMLRSVEALGIGDIWLAAGLGALVGPSTIPWLLFAAAVLGILMNSLASQANKRRYGVAFGAHLCAATLIFLPF